MIPVLCIIMQDVVYPIPKFKLHTYSNHRKHRLEYAGMPFTSSSKSEKIINIILNTKKSNEKTLLFSQWTMHLNALEKQIEHYNATSKNPIKYTRVDGTVPMTK